jgi:hypothetical protein
MSTAKPLGSDATADEIDEADEYGDPIPPPEAEPVPFADRSSLDLLLDKNGVYFERALSVIANRQLNKVTDTVIEATIYALRKGTAALSQENVRGWLSHTDEKRLREVCARVGRFKHAKAWTREGVERLVDMWVACHG